MAAVVGVNDKMMSADLLSLSLQEHVVSSENNRCSSESLVDLFSIESPSHDSNGSEICSPERTTENELEHDADSDTSGDESSFFDHLKNRAKTQEGRRKVRRTSSNMFVLKKHENDSEFFNDADSCNEYNDVELIDVDLHMSNDNSNNMTKPSLCKSNSSSTDENERSCNVIDVNNISNVSTTLSTSASTLHYGFPHRGESISSTSGGEDPEEKTKCKKQTAVDGLLFEIYDRFHSRGLSVVESDITECSTTSVNSVYVTSSFENDDRVTVDQNYLETKEICELEGMIKELKRGINMLSSKLVRLLKQRDRNAQKIQENFNILTALLQAISQKRRQDTRIRFSFIPRSGKRGFRQWIDALKAVARIRPGIPPTWRKRTWLSLAEYFLKDTDWDRIKKLCFNDRRNPDDDELDTQIVKDLHRTGCGWFFEHDTAEDRASLKRVLLAYARWNKSIGYCQGFNVIAALILQVMEGNEEDALKVMIFLVDYVLPRNYFANNLRALSVDMAVLRDLMLKKLPDLANLLQQLQMEAMDKTANSLASYEPPLINMFTMQWFLTLFATCLPRLTVLRIWDCVLLEGSEVLLRVALAMWAKLGMCFDENMTTASDFYMKMGQLIQELISDDFINVQKLMQTVYQMAPFPWPLLSELREKYTYDIHPFSTFKTDKKTPIRAPPKPVSDEEEAIDSDDDKMLGCLGFVASSTDQSPSKIKHQQMVEAKKNVVNSKSDITKVTPGAYITDQEAQNAYKAQMKESERMREKDLLDVNRLRSQYGRMRRLQQKAMLVFNNDFKDDSLRAKNPPSAINHLFVDVNKVAPPRARYRKQSNFPALKAPSKGIIPVPKPVSDNSSANRTSLSSVKEKNQTKIIHENNGTRSDVLQNSKATTTTISSNEQKSVKPKIDENPETFSFTNPYVAREIQASSDLNDLIKDKMPSREQQRPSKPSTPYETNFQINEPPKLTRATSRPMKGDPKNENDSTNSVLYQVHKSALYPSNFNPFPHRNNQRRSIVPGK